MKQLDGKIAIVTGARGGFGEAIARLFADEGARVLLADIDAAGGRRVAADIVVNNAGTTHRNQPMLDVDEATFDRVYAVNVKSIFHMAHAVVPLMRKRKGGRMSQPADLAAAALWLASDAARFITGIELPVDGGRTV